MQLTRRTRRAERGASSVEYALLVFAVAAVIVVVVVAFGTLVDRTFQDSCTRLGDKLSADAQCE